MKTLYFLSGPERAQEVHAMNADGSNARRITAKGIVPSPTISPDGRYFAYGRQSDDVWGIYVYEMATGTERRVIGGPLPPR